MPKRSRHFLFLSLVSVVVALAVGLWLLWPRTAITRENAAKIKVGMTLAEVESILGGPDRDEGTGTFIYTDESREWDGARGNGVITATTNVRKDGSEYQGRRMWKSDTVMILIDFNEEILVSNTESIGLAPVAESPLDMLRRWLHL